MWLSCLLVSLGWDIHALSSSFWHTNSPQGEETARNDNPSHYILWSLLLAWTCIYLPFSDWASIAGCQGAPPISTSYHISCLPLLSWLSSLWMCGLGLCPFSGLVCDLLLRNRRGLSPKAHCQRIISSHNRDAHCLNDIGMTWCLPWGGTIPWALRFLADREIWLWGLVSPRMHASPQKHWTDCIQ